MNESPTFQKHRLIVSLFLFWTDRPIASSSPDTSYTITEGLNLSIPCKWDGADATGSKWVFNGNAITTGFDANGLTLTGVKQISAGNYTCSATNDFGETQVHTTVDVISKYIPILQNCC